MKKQTDPNTVMVFSSNNSLMLGVAAELLGEADIPYLAKSEGTGGLMRILAGGFSIYATDLYVRKEDALLAKDVLAILEDDPKNTTPATE